MGRGSRRGEAARQLSKRPAGRSGSVRWGWADSARAQSSPRLGRTSAAPHALHRGRGGGGICGHGGPLADCRHRPACRPAGGQGVCWGDGDAISSSRGLAGGCACKVPSSCLWSIASLRDAPGVKVSGRSSTSSRPAGDCSCQWPSGVLLPFIRSPRRRSQTGWQTQAPRQHRSSILL